MSIVTLRKPIDLKIIRKRTEELFEKRKIIIPLLLGIAGIFIGNMIAEGESVLYLKLTEVCKLLFNESIQTAKLFLNSLTVPTVFFFIEFLSGLSISGVFILNFIPTIYGIIIGEISHYYYTTYSLKGLAYCVMIIFPYTALTMLSLVFNAKTNYSMSQELTTFITRKSTAGTLLMKNYSLNLLKNYLILVFGAFVNILCHHFFSDFFSF